MTFHKSIQQPANRAPDLLGSQTLAPEASGVDTVDASEIRKKQPPCNWDKSTNLSWLL